MDDLRETKLPLTVLGNMSFQPNRKHRDEGSSNGQNKRDPATGNPDCTVVWVDG